MAYKRMTEEKRRLIYRWIQEKIKIGEMGKRLGRMTSTISRELARNRGKRGYRPKQAHWKATERAKMPGARCLPRRCVWMLRRGL